MRLHADDLSRNIARRGGSFLSSFGHAFDGRVVMILEHLLVLDDLAIESVHQHVDGGIKVVRGTGDMDDLAREPKVDLGFLAFFFLGEIVNAEDDVGIDHLIEMAGNAFELVLYVFSDGWSYIEMMSADCEIHTHSFEDALPAVRASSAMGQCLLQGFAEADGRDFERFTILGDRAPRDDHSLFP